MRKKSLLALLLALSLLMSGCALVSVDQVADNARIIVDVNGETGPNQESDGEKYYDIRSFKIASFSINNACTKDEKLDGMCIKNLGTKYAPINCRDSSNAGTSYCAGSGSSFDYVSGARKACEDIGMELPDLGTLVSIAKNYKGQGIYRSYKIHSQNRFSR